MKFTTTCFALFFGVFLYSQTPKGIINDYVLLGSRRQSANTVEGVNIYNGNQMTTNQTANTNGQLAMFQMNAKSTNKLDRLSDISIEATEEDILIEFSRRENAISDFEIQNKNRIEDINTLYSEIPAQNFEKNINGQFQAHLFITTKNYSFKMNQEIVSEVPCVVYVEDNKIIQLFPYGKKGFELDYPKNMESSSYLSEGIVQYQDFKNDQLFTVVLLEPFLSEEPKQYEVSNQEFAFITLYTTKKKEEGNIVYIQEIDGNGNINRETSQPLVYAKDETEAVKLNIKPIAMNTKYHLFYFGTPAKTSYGEIPLFLRTLKEDIEPLKDHENRFVKILIYRN
tara:strand:- start:14340 stop:15359 length:1020 start_codon:yes stop_codon:yes gene_type:complete